MIKYRKLTHEDYNDIVEMCKDIWGGTDYLPELFHKWVDDKGIFLGAFDTAANKIIGVDKYSILYDGTGWLEGLRTHKNYRGQGIGKNLTSIILKKAISDLRKGKINKIAFSTHISSVESIGIMKHLGFKPEQEYILVQKNYQDADSALSAKDFAVESWEPSYEEFANLPYLKRRSGILPFVFYFQKPTPKLHEELLKEKCFISINNHKGLFKLKGEPHFIVFNESLHGINTFMNYYLLQFADKHLDPPLTSVIPGDSELIASLKAAGFGTMAAWTSDYLYFTYGDKL